MSTVIFFNKPTWPDTIVATTKTKTQMANVRKLSVKSDMGMRRGGST